MKSGCIERETVSLSEPLYVDTSRWFSLKEMAKGSLGMDMPV